MCIEVAMYKKRATNGNFIIMLYNIFTETAKDKVANLISSSIFE